MRLGKVTATTNMERLTVKRCGLSMGQTTSSCTSPFASSWPAMSSQLTDALVSRISLQTSSRILGSSFCSASGSSPSGPVGYILVCASQPMMMQKTVATQSSRFIPLSLCTSALCIPHYYCAIRVAIHQSSCQISMHALQRQVHNTEQIWHSLA